VGPWKKEPGGGGLEYLNQIRNEIRKGEAKVELVEPIFEESEIIQEYKSSRIFVYPSLAEKGETFGLSILESMSQGCVPLVSSLPCFQDFVSSENGFIFDAKNGRVESNLLQCLKTGIQSETYLQKFSDKAFEIAKEFEPSKVARLFLEDFKKME
jgi:glycosyltransferase involved in cell wall biosynthesis